VRVVLHSLRPLGRLLTRRMEGAGLAMLPLICRSGPEVIARGLRRAMESQGAEDDPDDAFGPGESAVLPLAACCGLREGVNCLLRTLSWRRGFLTISW